MSLHLLYALSLGNPVGGFSALDTAVAGTISYFAESGPEKCLRLLEGPPPRHLQPRLGNREENISIYTRDVPENGIDLIIRASFPSRIWPLGEWVVWDGVHISPDNTARSFTDDELAEVW